MKILAAIKPIPNPDEKVKIKPDGAGIILDAPAKSHMVLAANGGHLVHSGADAMNQRRTIDRKAA